MLLGLTVIAIAILRLLWASRKFNNENPKEDQIRQLPQRRMLLGFDVALMFADWVQQSVSLEKSAQWIQSNGKTFAVLIGGRTNVWTADATNAKAILADKAEDFELSYAREVAFRPALGKGMIAVNGQDWVQGRKLLVQSLPSSRVRSLSQYEPHFRNLMAHIPVNGSTVDLQQFLPFYTMDTITQILLGSSVNWLTDMRNKNVQDLSEALDYINEVVRFRGDIGPFVYLHWNRRFNRSCSAIHELMHSIVREQAVAMELADPLSEKDSAILPFVKAYTGSTEDKQTVCDQLLTAIMAGRDTTASLIGFTIWSLARNERVQHKLRQCLEEVKKPVTSYSSLSRIPYLWHVIKEVLRLYPSIPANDRLAKRDTHMPAGGGECGLNPAHIAAGQVIDLHIFAIQRDRDLWGDDAEEFVPERWTQFERHAGFMPFGGGPRTCPGQDLAMVQAAFITVRLLQSSAWIESRDSLPFKEQVSISLTSANGFKVAFLPRQMDRSDIFV